MIIHTNSNNSGAGKRKSIIEIHKKSHKNRRKFEYFKLLNLPVDLLLIILKYLSFHDILQVQMIDKEFRKIIDRFQQILYKNLCWKHFSFTFGNSGTLGNSGSTEAGTTKATSETCPKTLFQRHYNLQNARFRFFRTENDIEITSKGTVACDDYGSAIKHISLPQPPIPKNDIVHLHYMDKTVAIKKHGSFKLHSKSFDPSQSTFSPKKEGNHLDQPLSVWPILASCAYLVAVDTNHICWIDQTDLEIVYIALFTNTPLKKITPKHKLIHGGDLGLLLTNGMNQLLAFDETSSVFVWSLTTFCMTRKIDTLVVLGRILSMNVMNDRLVSGGENGKVALWNINTGDCLFVIDRTFPLRNPTLQSNPDSNQDNPDPQSNLHAALYSPLNVGIHRDAVVFGMRTGKYVVTRINSIGDGRDKVIQKQQCEIDVMKAARDLSLHEQALLSSNNDNLGEREREMPEQLLMAQEFHQTLTGEVDDHQSLAATGVNGWNLQGNAREPPQPPAMVPLDLQLQLEMEMDMETEMMAPQQQQQLTMIPRTLVLNSHILLTNEPDINHHHHEAFNEVDSTGIQMWDLRTGTRIARFSEQLAVAQQRMLSMIHPQDFGRHLRLAEMSRDSSIVFSTVGVEQAVRDDEEAFGLDMERPRLLVWDFEQQNKGLVCFKAGLYGQTSLPSEIEIPDLEVWIICRRL